MQLLVIHFAIFINNGIIVKFDMKSQLLAIKGKAAHTQLPSVEFRS